MILIKEKSNCTGCSACQNICAKNCIVMKPDNEGFCYPVIDSKECINCSMCEEVCPVLREPVKSQKTSYAAYSKDEDIRKNSSSGGVFSVLALNILSKGGVVFGAAFDGVTKVKHIYTDNEKDLCKLRTSKYIQSEIGNSYKKAKEFLDNDREVLFTGTPCQVAGLMTFLRKPYDNLYTQDVICHGVPSGKVWAEYIKTKEKSERQRILSVNFRDKIDGWNSSSIAYISKNKYEHISNNKDLFYKGFIKNIILRPSCYACRFKNDNFYSDITLGDFWGIGQVMPEMDDNGGTSLVICNTDKGKKLLTDVSNLLVIKEADYDKAVNNNTAAIKPVYKPGSRDLFFNRIKHRNIIKELKLFCSGNEKSIKKIQFLEDHNSVKTEKGRIYSLLWRIKNIFNKY